MCDRGLTPTVNVILYTYVKQKTLTKGYDMFPSDGRNHKNAIKNELNTKSFLEKNAHKIFEQLSEKSYEVLSKGGTKSKADNIIQSSDGAIIYISDKEKRHGLGGSYDYTNTSAAIKDLGKAGKYINTLNDEKNEVLKKSLSERKELVDTFRDKIKDVSYQTLKSIETKELINLLEKYLINPNKTMEMFITDGVKGKRYIFPFTNHPINNLMKNKYAPVINVKKGKSSGRILFVKNRQEVDIGLRVRIHTNNGATAYLKAGGSNPSAMFVLKFQQDGIKKLLKEVNPIVI